MVNAANGDRKKSLLIYEGVIPYAKTGFFKPNTTIELWPISDLKEVQLQSP